MSISAVIPSYNRPELLRRLLKSIASQTIKPDETIVVDDGSKDERRYIEVISEFAVQIPSLRYLRNTKSQGASASRNRGIHESRFDWIAFTDDDDEWLPKKTEEQLQIVKEDPAKVALIYTWCEAISEGKTVQTFQPLAEGPAVAELLKSNFIPSPSVLARKTVVLQAGLFDPKLRSCQDWDLWTRMLARDHECRVVQQVLTRYHHHGGERVGSGDAGKLRGYFQYYFKHRKLFFELGMKGFWLKSLAHCAKTRLLPE